MKKLKFGSKKLNIKSEALCRLIDTVLACDEISRASVSKSASVSLATAGKLLSAMDECRFTDRIYKRADGSGSPSKLHIIHNDISVLVLDLSSYAYSTTVSLGKIYNVIFEKHIYDPKLSFEGNLLVFLSKVGMQISRLPYSVSAICTIIADDPERVLRTSLSSACYPVSQADVAVVNHTCAQLFGIMPILNLTLSQALTCAARYGIINCGGVRANLSYIRFGESFDAIYLPAKSAPVSCRLDSLVIDESNRLSTLIEAASSSYDLAYLLMRSVNFMDCAYPTDTFFVEYDLNGLGDAIQDRIARSFKAIGVPAPQIEYLSNNPPAASLGASVAALSSFIKAHITGI